AYEILTTSFPSRPENDRALYQLARVYDDLGLKSEMLSVLEDLVERFPGSPLREEAVFRLAEAYFDSADFKIAKPFYLSAASRPAGEFYEPARYKLAWTEFYLQNYAGAADHFSALIDQRRMPGEEGELRLDPAAMSATEWDNVLELIRGISLSFSNMGPPSVIGTYFKKRGHRDYEDLIYRKLGDLYLTQKRFKDAVKAYRAFIQANPLHEEAPIVQMDIIEAYQGVNLVASANKARVGFLDQFGPGTEWDQTVAEDVRQSVRPLQKQIMGELAVFYHAEAQKMKRKKDYEKTVRWYTRFLEGFPEEPESGRIQFLLGEGLLELGRLRQAATAFKKSAYEYPIHLNSSEAGYAAVLTLERMTKTRQGKTEKKQVLIELAEISKRFWEAFPGDDRARAVLWKGAEIYYQAGDYRTAREMAQEIVNSTPPKDRESIRARKLIGTAFFEEGHYTKAADVYRGIAQTGIGEAESRNIKNLWASALYKQAETSKEQGKLRQAQTEFMRVHAEVPGTAIAAVALFDSGNVALSREKPAEAVQLF
ncbi:MAG TPA: tetratricopeptide repeat protein, partial [Nitrospiria bacterium]|nr:tetratricopeptide repeat protein [Nitrospiria bacterium]